MEERVASTNDVIDGQMTTVLVGGKKVLLARVDSQFFATAARCPHWGGPLPEGGAKHDVASYGVNATSFAASRYPHLHPLALPSPSWTSSRRATRSPGGQYPQSFGSP